MQKVGFRKGDMFGLDSHDTNFMAGNDGQAGGPADWNEGWEDEECWMLNETAPTVSPIAVANKFVGSPMTEHESSECIASVSCMDAPLCISTCRKACCEHVPGVTPTGSGQRLMTKKFRKATQAKVCEDSYIS